MVVRVSSSFKRAQNPKSAKDVFFPLAWLYIYVCHTALTQFDLSIKTKQNVVRLDIPVNDPQVVKMMYALKRFAANGGYLGFGHHIGRHHIRERSSLHVLHHNPQFASREKGINKVHDVLVLSFTHHQNFVDNEFLLWLLRQVHLLNSNRNIRVH